MIRLSAAALAAILLLSAAAWAGETMPRGGIKLAQADDQPMVITPQPRGEQLPPPQGDPGGPGVPYEPAPGASAPLPGDPATVPPPPNGRGTFSAEEIKDAGHRFFGSVSMGLAKAIEYTFQRAGRPNGYILGEEAGGAIIAGLRYGEGTLYTKDAGEHHLYWQGPSVGYDLGAEGSKTMVLVYNLRAPGEIYSAFAGVDGSAYLVGGVGVTFLADSHVILAPIRSGLGLRLGANIGYLKYTREPTWNPF
ncbi:DUF1134 domain-containing protein [Methyloceanibacter sp.]|uniref:DUF1134 domain-containing protein n=1 Tax=Methyloceanibacter sp. TaxID=1965321 RepID=UPI003D6CBD03